MTKLEVAESIKQTLRNSRVSAHQQIDNKMKGMVAILLVVDHGRSVCAGDIAERLGVSTARIAVAVDTLEKKGFVVKAKSFLDKRKTIVDITEEGKTFLEKKKKEIHESIMLILNKLTDEEAELFDSLIKKIYL